MRPIRRGKSPRNKDFDEYTDAKPHLISRFGDYCSYCERRIVTQLAVEHIQPKGLSVYQHLIGRWENFLLACVNCNSTKKDKEVKLSDILLPDRDNTALAFHYMADGNIVVSPSLNPTLIDKAKATLSLTGLDKKISAVFDENGKQIAIDRIAQRMEVWLVAKDAYENVLSDPENEAIRRCVIRIALGYGFFSIWMAVFEHDPDIRNRLIDAFSGTRQSGCFDPDTTKPISPAPNPDGLHHGGKL